MDNQVIGYKDLAAIPKDKAILDIERPDLMMYEPHFSYSPMEVIHIIYSKYAVQKFGVSKIDFFRERMRQIGSIFFLLNFLLIKES